MKLPNFEIPDVSAKLPGHAPWSATRRLTVRQFSGPFTDLLFSEFTV
jgi:hypothetical protein